MCATTTNAGVPVRDPDRSRADLLAAAIDVVERAGTSVVGLDAIAAAAGVDAREAATVFASVDELLVAAALRMCAADLQLATIAVPTVSAYARHFAGRRVFYRAMRIGPVAQMLDARMAELMAPLIAEQIRTLVGAHMTEEALATMTVEVTAEAFEVTNGWIVGSGESASAESLYVELEAIVVRRFDGVRALQRD